ncbi:hypothetical protein C6502_19840 [Candidatus Poribacteria bacterium]|nr:MAG: hypothetical protein C6502_19840 [Candidatus Poribacteria bacterium]
MVQRKGCYRRVVTTGLVVAIIIAAVGALLYQRLGGPEGARYWMAERALNAIEAHLLMKAPDGSWLRKPDGVSVEEIGSQFERVREATTDRRTDLMRLNQILKEYQSKFQNAPPATSEVLQFLNAIEGTIVSKASVGG